jgi:hypothetical protein
VASLEKTLRKAEEAKDAEDLVRKTRAGLSLAAGGCVAAKVAWTAMDVMFGGSATMIGLISGAAAAGIAWTGSSILEHFQSKKRKKAVQKFLDEGGSSEEVKLLSGQ